ncbi:MAG TPA: hypothetical protein VGK79_17455 [Gaiellaceae bacterium]
MANPEPDDDVSVDPSTIELRYRHARARRVARVRAKEESRLARYRFWIALTVLLALATGFIVASWHEVHRLFGI